MKTICVAKAALFNEKGEVLLIRRSKTAPFRPNQMDIPGGWIEENESPLAAVVREIEEEVEVKLKDSDVELLYSATRIYEDRSVIRFLFVAYISSEQKITLSFEHSEYIWLPFSEALKKYDHDDWVGGLKYIFKNGLIKT